MKDTLAHRFRHAAEAPPASEDVPVFSVELEGSALLKSVQRRNKELGWKDERGKEIHADMVAAERAAFPTVCRAHDWFDEVGDPTPEDWDDHTYHARGRA